MAIRVTADTTLYQEFQIELHRIRDDLLAARVVVSPLGESSEVQFPIPLSRTAIEEALASISYAAQDYIKRSAGPNNDDQIKAMGSALFNALIESTPIGRHWRAAQEMSNAPSTALRLRLRSLDLEVLNIPWEFLFDSIQNSMVVLSAKTPVVRQRGTLSLPLPPLQGPLRVLVLTAEVTPRNAEKEIAFLNQLATTSGGMMELQVVSAVTKEQMKDLLATQGYHIVHFIGVGAWSPGRSRWEISARPLELQQIENGLLVFPDKASSSKDRLASAQFLAAQELQSRLSTNTNLRLVILNAYESDLLAADLAYTLPAVLGMRSKLSDGAAMALIQGIYEALVTGQPLEAAITRGRQRIDSQNPGTREYGLPVFYLNTVDGTLLSPDSGQPPSKGVKLSMPTSSATYENITQQAREEQRIRSLITIEEQTLATFVEQQSALGTLTPPHIAQEIQQAEKRLEDLKRQLAQSEA